MATFGKWRLRSRRKGGNTIGYVLLAALIGVVSIAGIMGAGEQNRENARFVACTIEKVLTGSNQECERVLVDQALRWSTPAGRIALLDQGEDVPADTRVQAALVGGGAVTYTIFQGGLPTGVTMNAAGLVSGTASGAEGVYGFTVQAAGADKLATRTFEIWVGAPPVWQTV